MKCMNMPKVKNIVRCIDTLEKELKQEHDFKRKEDLQKAINGYREKIQHEVNKLNGGF